MNRFTLVIGIFAILSLECSSTRPLTDNEKAKLDPPLNRLLAGEEAAIDKINVSYRTDGSKEYAVIIRSDKPEEIKNLGVPVTSVFSDVIVSHVTIEELRKIISLSSVRAVETGSKNTIQQNK